MKLLKVLTFGLFSLSGQVYLVLPHLLIILVSLLSVAFQFKLEKKHLNADFTGLI